MTTILKCDDADQDEATEPMTYLEQHHPAFVAELLALAALLDEDD